MHRIILDILILICVIQGWWFIALPLAIFCMWRFPLFVEIIIAGVMYDCLFGIAPDMGVWGYAGTIMTVVGFMIVSIFKKIVRK